jgi:sigma-E factor negative regulatory protein RseC
MIEVAARVLACEDDRALVEAEPQGCAGCRALHGLFTRRRNLSLHAHNAIRATAGERVRIGIAPDALLAAALWLYGVPLTGLIAGAGAGAVLGEWQSMTGAAFGLAVGLLLARRHTASTAGSGRQAVILRRLPETEPALSCPTALNVTFEERP